MNCYRIALPSETSLSIAENAPLVPYVPNQDEELTAVLMSATLALEVTYRWSCFAENDGGIDASSEEVETKPLLPQNFVFDRGIPAGYLFQSHVLSLTEKNPVLLEENDDFEYVPCWGTVSDSYSYRLCTIPDKEHLLLRDKSLLRYEAGCLIEQGELIATCGNFSGEVRLPDGITAIAKGIFCDNKTLESVILPEGLVSIKDEAFKGCTALEKITFPSTLTSIGSWAFYHCDRLTTLALPETLDEIGSCAFARNPALTDVTLPDSLTVIPYALFVGCTALTSLTLPEGLCKIDRNAFEDCTALKELVIPDTVTTIGTYAFKNCTALERVTLSASLETLYDYAFENCVALKAITTPPTLGEISFATFRGCTALSKVTLSEGLTTVNSLAFDGCSSLTELALPSTLKKLGAYPFKETAITSLTLPDGLTSLDFALLGGTKIETFTVQKALAEHLMQYHLHNAAFLKTLIFAEGVTVIHHPDEFRVRYGNEDVRFPAGIAKTLKTVETIVLPGTLTDFDPMLLLDAPALKTVRIAKGFEKLTPEILPEGITLTLEGMPADWSALDDAFKTALKEKNITLVFSDETVRPERTDSMKKTLHIIPHSHWDREWYLPFEKHRTRLIDLFDNLIEVMEENEDYTYYHMDGQYVVIEDYLEVRPSMRERLLALIRAGRIQIGPWYVLQDEYLTSGEANVRNMLYGIRLCREIGAEPVECGYFPDAFGNISQAPQIVRGFGFDNAVFGRGVNDVGADNEVIKQNGLTKSEMIWRSPDGSEVLGVMFCNWYHNAMELPEEPEALKKRIAHIVVSTSRFATTDHLLGMNGCDHQPLQKNLHKVIRLANEVQDEVTVKQSNFKEYIELIRKNAKDLKVFEGEINSQFTSGWGNLISTASAHIDIKQDNHKAQHLLAGIAEPLSVLLLENGGKYKGDLFLYAWKKLMQNHPHDSICSCSCDEVYDEMKVRFMKAITCTEELRDYALEKLTAAVNTDNLHGDAAIVVYSLSPNKAAATVTADVDFDKGTDLKYLSLFDDHGNEIPATFTHKPNTFTYTLPEDRFRQPRYVDRVTVEFPVTTDGIGYRTYVLRFRKPQKKESLPHGFGICENDAVRLTIKENGSFDLYDKRSKITYPGLHLFEDSADHGNLYNYVQPEGDIPVLSSEHTAKITLHEASAYKVTYKVALTLMKGVKLTSYLTLTKGVARVDIRTTVENQKSDHRLRALFPTAFKTETVMAQGQFDVVRRKITPEFTWKNPCNAQRMESFVTLQDEEDGRSLLIATRGLPEYEVLRDGKNTLALTLLRSVGEVGDWGIFPTPKGQKHGTYTLEYSVIPYQKSEEERAFSEAFAFSYPTALAVGTTSHKGTLPDEACYLQFDSEYIRMSAFKKKEDGESAVLRLYNTHTEAVKLMVTLADCYREANLLTLGEELVEALPIENGKLILSIPAKKILTVELVSRKETI